MKIKHKIKNESEGKPVVANALDCDITSSSNPNRAIMFTRMTFTKMTSALNNPRRFICH